MARKLFMMVMHKSTRLNENSLANLLRTHGWLQSAPSRRTAKPNSKSASYNSAFHADLCEISNSLRAALGTASRARMGSIPAKCMQGRSAIRALLLDTLRGLALAYQDYSWKLGTL